ncbi:PIN domain nuclease [Candidatus Poriferisodalis sp.]|uniref:PIN domain nuclease n=1 Tax=Candidatus Poriferisodalis sp. TaxID=3101277 RepID=UPI003B5BB124
MARATHLADTSAFARLRQPHVRAAAAPLIASGRVALCAPVIYELGFSARNAADHDEIMNRIDAFELAQTTDGDFGRALDIQRRLVRRGHHRAVSLVDALAAAVAENCGLIVLHYDADFDLIADITGQPTEWIVERGTAD